MFRKLLVPLDGSPLSENALPLALSIARTAGAEIHIALVHVPDTFGDFAHAEDPDSESKARQRQYLDSLADKLVAGSRGPIHIHHLEGIVPETLTEEVVERRIDLVVMNAHGWGYISRALLGSVSDYLMRHLTVPILLTHADSACADLLRPMSFQRVLICLDGSALAETILAPVAALGELGNLESRLLRVVAQPSHSLPGDSADAGQQQMLKKIQDVAAAYLATVANRLDKSAAAIHTQVTISGNVVAAILQEAKASACDLIAISTHGRGGLPRLLLGSVADKVIRGANQAVLVCRGAR